MRCAPIVERARNQHGAGIAGGSVGDGVAITRGVRRLQLMPPVPGKPSTLHGCAQVWLLSICHVVFAVCDRALDLDLLHLLQTVRMLQQRQSAQTGSLLRFPGTDLHHAELRFGAINQWRAHSGRSFSCRWP